MKVYLVNDCSRACQVQEYNHAGSAAIIKSLVLRFSAAGHEIIAIEPKPGGPTHENIWCCNWVVINGEGTFRHESVNYEPGRHDRMFNGIQYALRHGKRVYLINATWHQMSKRWAKVLRRLDGISVREPASQREIKALCGVLPEVHPDEAYFLPAPDDELGPRNGIVWGKWYRNNATFACWPNEDWGLHTVAWDALIRKLRNAELYVTGQHHGVIAACKARCPFAAVLVNTHKLTALFEWAGAKIPLASNDAELDAAMGYARNRPEEYAKLFDFMERQTPWPVPAN